MSDPQPVPSAPQKRVDVQAALAAAQNQTSVAAPAGDWTLLIDLKLVPNTVAATPKGDDETPRPPRPKNVAGQSALVGQAPIEIRQISVAVNFSTLQAETVAVPQGDDETPRPPRPKGDDETPRPPRPKGEEGTSRSPRKK